MSDSRFTAITRRRWLGWSGTAIGLGELQRWLPFSPLSAAEVAVTPRLVSLRPEIAPIVALIESTPRERCVEMLAGQLKAGVPFRELMAAAFLHAAQHDGHHTVYLVHAALELSKQVEPAERLLPLFWAVDVVKEHIERFKEVPAPLLRGELPPAANAAAELNVALNAWEQERAELAVIALARAEGPQAALQRLCWYAARDWSFIGHVPIAVSNAWRTLEVIGPQHAEPTLRYLVREIHERNSNRTKGQSYDANLALVQRTFAQLPPDWSDTRDDGKATLELLQVIRTGNWNAASQWAAKELTAGRVRAGAVWDAVHVASAEFMVRFSLGNIRMGNRALHSNTSGNALHHLFKACEDARTRYLILLQAASWAADFQKVEAGRGMLRELSLTEMPPVELPATREASLEKIFAVLPPRPFQKEINDRSGQDEASRLAFAYAQAHGACDDFLATARRLVIAKATINSHDVKFPIAIFENRDWVNPAWRPHLLAASVHFLHGTRMIDSEVTQRAREAI